MKPEALTVRSLALGALLAVVLGAANAYLGDRFIPDYNALPGVNLSYPAAWALVVLVLGLSSYRAYRKNFMSVN